MKIIEKLSTYAALLGVIGAIGGGFYTWGQFNSRLDMLEAEPPVNLAPLKEKDKELEKKIDEALLYANEYKVDLIDRIKKVDDKIVPTDLTLVTAIPPTTGLSNSLALNPSIYSAGILEYWSLVGLPNLSTAILSA